MQLITRFREDVLKQIASCCHLPLSIIMIGVGDENFKSMKQIENVELLRKYAEKDKADDVRSITQFVAFHDFKNDTQKLVSAVLNCLPVQFLEYMRRNKIEPQQRLRVQMSKMDL